MYFEDPPLIFLKKGNLQKDGSGLDDVSNP